MIKIKLILPKTVVKINPRVRNLYFLAGPIQGGDDWQATAAKLLGELDPDCYVVCPCRYNNNHELFQYRISDTDSEYMAADENDLFPQTAPFPNQTLWERFYMELASYYGCIIFWLPKESVLHPRKEGPYAQDTYGEISRWSIKSANVEMFSVREPFYSIHPPHANVVIGAEKGFFGLETIKTNLTADHLREFPVYTSLEETVKAGVRLGIEYSFKPFFAGNKR